MIQFQCKNCGQKISVPKTHAGKKGKCRRCGSIIVIPEIEDASPVAGKSNFSDSEVKTRYAGLDSALFDIPQRGETENQLSSKNSVFEKAFEELKRPDEALGKNKTGQISERKLPCFIDIFLYPMNFWGLINLVIFIGVPSLIDTLGTILPIQLSFLFSLVALVVKALIFLYIYWYFAECVRDSADGGVRAPEGLGATPDLACMFWQTVNIIGCLGVFFGPFVLYILFAKRADIIFWLLLSFAVSFYPMGLLAVIMFDSARGLNPRLLISSISNTFFPYCGLILLFVTPAVLISMFPTKEQQSFFGEFIIRSVIVYIVLIGAHFLGRFYWRYQEKLNWEV